jgi:hypothetical protein
MVMSIDATKTRVERGSFWHVADAIIDWFLENIRTIDVFNMPFVYVATLSIFPFVGTVLLFWVYFQSYVVIAVFVVGVLYASCYGAIFFTIAYPIYFHWDIVSTVSLLMALIGIGSLAFIIYKMVHRLRDLRSHAIKRIALYLFDEKFAQEHPSMRDSGHILTARSDYGLMYSLFTKGKIDSLELAAKLPFIWNGAMHCFRVARLGGAGKWFSSALRSYLDHHYEVQSLSPGGGLACTPAIVRAEYAMTEQYMLMLDDTVKLEAVETAKFDQEPGDFIAFDISHDKFMKWFHNRWIHLFCAFLNAGLIFFMYYWFSFPLLVQILATVCFLVAAVVNVIWGIVGLRRRQSQLLANISEFLPSLLGKAMILFLDFMIAPTAKMTLQLWIPTATQCAAPHEYRPVVPVTDGPSSLLRTGWHEFLFRHDAPCTPCSLPVNNSLCSDLCGFGEISFLFADPSLRFGRDVRTPLMMHFIWAACLLLTWYPATYQLFIGRAKSRLITIPIFGRTMAEKWRNLMTRMSGPFMGMFCNYRHDCSYWIVLKHFLKVVVMFTSGIQASSPRALTVFAIAAPIANFLYLLLLLSRNPYMSFLNYAYELAVTSVSMLFPVIYRFLPYSSTYSTVFPALMLSLGIAAIVVLWRYDRWKRFDDVSDPSCPTGTQLTLPCGCLSHCLPPVGAENGDETVTIHQIDLMDIALMMSAEDDGPAPIGGALTLNARRVRICTERALQAMSAACTEEDIKLLLYLLASLGVGGLATAGWYLGSGYGLFLERLNLKC